MKYKIKQVGVKHIDWVGLILSTELPNQCKSIAMYLGRFMNKDQDVAWPSISRIQAELTLGRSTVCRSMKILEDDGWIVRDRGNSKTNTRYYISFPIKGLASLTARFRGPQRMSVSKERMMNKQEYMQDLLCLCSEKQQALFIKMYPQGPSQKQLKTAIFQIKNTLKNGNKDTEELKQQIKQLKDQASDFDRIKAEYRKTITELEQEIKSARNESERLKNPISIENDDIQKDLMRLQALKEGGVDNWEWYGESIRSYEKEHGVEL